MTLKFDFPIKANVEISGEHSTTDRVPQSRHCPYFLSQTSKCCSSLLRKQKVSLVHILKIKKSVYNFLLKASNTQPYLFLRNIKLLYFSWSFLRFILVLKNYLKFEPNSSFSSQFSMPVGAKCVFSSQSARVSKMFASFDLSSCSISFVGMMGDFAVWVEWFIIIF